MGEGTMKATWKDAVNICAQFHAGPCDRCPLYEPCLSRGLRQKPEEYVAAVVAAAEKHMERSADNGNQVRSEVPH